MDILKQNRDKALIWWDSLSLEQLNCIKQKYFSNYDVITGSDIFQAWHADVMQPGMDAILALHRAIRKLDHM